VGVPFGALEVSLRDLFVRVAESELAAPSKRQTDSRIALVKPFCSTSLRKDVSGSFNAKSITTIWAAMRPIESAPKSAVRASVFLGELTACCLTMIGIEILVLPEAIAAMRR
jgi:hypothetical protein